MPTRKRQGEALPEKTKLTAAEQRLIHRPCVQTGLMKGFLDTITTVRDLKPEGLDTTSQLILRGLDNLILKARYKRRAKPISDIKILLEAGRFDLWAADTFKHGGLVALANLDARLLKASGVGR